MFPIYLGGTSLETMYNILIYLVIIPISWMLENAATESQENQHSESGLDLHPTEQFYSSPEEEQEDSVMENFNESAERFNYSNENEGDSDDLSLIPAS